MGAIGSDEFAFFVAGKRGHTRCSRDWSSDVCSSDLATDSTWTITGRGEGAVGGVEFTGVEDLVGGPDNQDTFVFLPGGGLDGHVEGGARGFDGIVIEGGTYTNANFVPSGPDSGTIELDGDVIRYRGLEPISVTASILNPTVNGTGGDDILTVSGGLDVSAPITVSGNGGFETRTISQPREVNQKN